MGSGGVLSVICAAMAVGTYLMGTVPLFFQVSPTSLRKLELWGAGLLLGAALTVVVPEGIANVYKDRMCDSDGHTVPQTHWLHPKDLIALSLLSGFLLMLLYVRPSHRRVDPNLTQLSYGAPQSECASDMAATPLVDSATAEAHATVDTDVGTRAARSSLSTVVGSLLGVLVHAAADGIAMGSAVESTDSSLRLIVVLAIIVHKAPASIGICTMLMAQQLPRPTIRGALLVFSLATPISAIVTYVLLLLLAHATGSTSDGINAHEIGIILSFSGGTFLYVAMRAVLELPKEPPRRVHGHEADTLPTDRRSLSPGPRTLETAGRSRPYTGDTALTSAVPASWRSPPAIVFLLLGSILPLLLQLLVGEHSHGAS